MILTSIDDLNEYIISIDIKIDPFIIKNYISLLNDYRTKYNIKIKINGNELES